MMDQASLHERAGEIFLEALEMDSAEQNSFVESQCRGNPELLEEVNSLLRHHACEEDHPLDHIEKNIQERFETLNVDEIVTECFGKPPGEKEAEGTLKKKSTTRNVTGVLVSQLFGSKYRRIIVNSLAFIAFGIFGYVSFTQIKGSLSQFVQNDLESVIASRKLGFSIWAEDHLRDVEFWASRPDINAALLELIQYSRDSQNLKEAWEHPSLRYLNQHLKSHMEIREIVGFSVINRSNQIVGHWSKVALGTYLSPKAASHLTQVLEGESKFRIPYSAEDWYSREDSILGQTQLVWFDTPIYDRSGNVLGIFSFAHLAQGKFAEIVSGNDQGKTGETYAFDGKGRLITSTRFDEELKQLTKLKHGSSAVFNVPISQPASKGFEPDFTKPVEETLRIEVHDREANIHTTLTPYPDMRGEHVIGAWVWMKGFDFGIITEIEADEVFHTTYVVYIAFVAVYVILLVVLCYSIFANSAIVSLRSRILEGRQLGSYTLLDKIGEGGMGQVYLAKHGLLKRPTAVKVLKKLVDSENKRKFEEEAQLASSLSHPNTINIYDYGQTEDGVFYYAMEFLRGITLSDLIKIETMLPPSRVVYLLKQACYSLREAHERGLVHRDIKPMNIMVCCIGGMYDFVKILDFGLVKDIEKQDQTKTKVLAATPLYMAPERLRQTSRADIRVDIYSLGAVAYEMLTGRPVFSGSNDMDVLFDVVNTIPKDINSHTTNLVPNELASIVMDCLSKSPEDRPRDMNAFIQRLDQIPLEAPWSEHKAEVWWEQNVKASRRLHMARELSMRAMS